MKIHTPAPWAVSQSDFGCIAILEYSPDRVLTVSPVCRMATPEEREANASLIAAAPELLEGLRHQIYRNHAYSETCDACRKSIQAVRKAEGKP